jgi:CheY-like chemotaxis protein
MPAAVDTLQSRFELRGLPLLAREFGGLPFAAIDRQRQQAWGVEPERKGGKRRYRMGQKIEPSRIALIVEDDFEVRGLAAALLEETDLKVVEAASAEEALNYLRDHAEEVAFLFADIRLPCLMNGVDLARTVRIKWPWVRTVLTSGLAPEDEVADVPRDVRFMPKPWRALEVLMEAERASQSARSH